jgi:hypothetical protein
MLSLSKHLRAAKKWSATGTSGWLPLRQARGERLRWAFAVILAMVFQASPARAADARCEAGLVTAARQFDFARTLIDEGEYFRAAGEGRRYLAFYEPCGRLDEARLLVGAAYLRGAKWDEAGAVFRSLANQATGPVGAAARLALGDTLLRAGRYEAAAAEFAAAPSDAAAGGYARYRTGFAYFLARDAVRARRAFAAVPPASDVAPQARRMAVAAAAWHTVPAKSPVAAGVLSAVLPGAGQIYTRRYADGVVSFFVNGVFIAGTAEAFRRDVPVAGVILGLFELGWYTGNIFSAVNYAERFNERAIEGYQREWQQRELVERDWAAAAAGETRYLRFGVDFE